MSDTIIEIENLSKQYRLGEVSTGSLGHDLNRWWHRVRGKEDPYLTVTQTNDRTGTTKNQEPGAKNNNNDYVWALKDINFEVQRGEVLGIIGRNGAGKSTLLKILSRVTAPTTGEIRVDGRIASLLEVGTGFHQDLTGRENIFLNGAILGMTKDEIRSKLDEIVEFSGCARYLDTPVKRYSSGMVVRLGFAVAAHLEPDILVVDEVLAVGDVEFQKKCIGKMQDVASHGRTVLFVSHNMGMISSLCDRAILLKNGRIIDDDITQNVVASYQGKTGADKGSVDFSPSDRPGDDKVRLRSARIVNCSGEASCEVDINHPFQLEMEFELLKSGMHIYPGFHVKDEIGTFVFATTDSQEDPDSMRKTRAGVYKAVCHIPANLLNSQVYFIDFAVGGFGTGNRHITSHVFEKGLLTVNVKDPIENVPTRLSKIISSPPGTVRPLLDWHVEKLS